MVTRTLVSTFIGLLAVASTYADLQLIPRIEPYELEGLKFEHLAFSDGSKKVTYSPPDGWEYSGSESKLTLRPRNKPEAQATITKLALQEPRTLDEATMKKLAEEAVGSVPEQSTEVSLVSEQKNPVVINGKETFLVILEYNLFGRKFGRSVLFLNRGKEQLRCELVSPLADFKELQRAFFASQFSWQQL